MPFNFNNIQSVEFGVCLDNERGEVFRIVPADIFGVRCFIVTFLPVPPYARI